MKENIRILVEGTTGEGTADEEITGVKTEGIFKTAAGRKHIIYEEHPGGTEEITKTHVVISEDSVEIRKRGEAEAYFLFREGAAAEGFYGTRFGKIRFIVRTESLSVAEGEKSLEIGIRYELVSGSGTLAACRIRFHAENI